MNGSTNLADFDAPAIPVLDGAKAMDRSKQPSEDDRRQHNHTHSIAFASPGEKSVVLSEFLSL